MSTVARGNAAEVLCTKQLEHDGWVCGSRRHIGGPGDVLAIRWHGINHEVRLIEVKRGAHAFENFRSMDRAALYSAAQKLGADAYLYHYGIGATEPDRYHWTDWPNFDERTAESRDAA